MWTYQCTIAQQILVNEVKLCTLKIQHDVQLAMAKFCWSIKDCQSQASFNDSTIKGLGPKILAYRVLVGGGTWVCPIMTLSPSIKASSRPTKMSENNKKTITSPSRLCPSIKVLHPHRNFQKTKGRTTAYVSKTIA